jgi:hypothetical protein
MLKLCVTSVAGEQKERVIFQMAAQVVRPTILAYWLSY